MKYAAYGSIAIIVSWTTLAICQLWFQPVTASLFVKITITAGLALVALVIVALIYREYSNEQVMKSDRFID